MRDLRVLAAICLPIALVLAGAPAATEAAPTRPAATVAHPQDGDAHDDADAAAHAAEDLAGMPVSEVERRTAASKARITQETGREPGAARPQQQGAGEATFSAAAVSPDPAVSGRWSPVLGTEVVPVMEALLPSGRVLIWDSVGDNAAESYPNHTFTRAMVWDPAGNTYKRVDVQGYNIFCAGFAHLPNGDVLVAGGNANADLDGTVTTHIFHWRTESWTRGADMAAGRWYPSVTTMANGEAVIVGGGPSPAEVYQTNGAIRRLPSFTDYSARRYPFMISRPDGLLGLFGPYNTTYSLATAGGGAVTGTGVRDGKDRSYGSFATYDIGKSLVTGGGSLTEGGVPMVPTRTAVVVSNNAGLVPKVATTGSLATGRRQFDTTVLSDGSVLATGGLTSTARSNLVDLDHAATAAERWDPATGAWTVLAGASRIRQYHSTALLLPDGRVMTGGGGVCGVCMTVGYLEKNVEYFTPPFLFRRDGSGAPASRPVISAAPATVAVGTTFTVSSTQAAGVRRVALVGLGDVTHGVDQGQRYVPLPFSASGTTLTVTGPPNGGVTPPGYYMLVLVDQAGVPSVAKMVQVARGPAPVLSAVKNSGAGRCIDVPQGSLAIRTYLQSYACNNRVAQALTRLPNDRTLRVLGNCLDVPSANLVAGQRIWTYTCNGSSAQTWRFSADGTIRPTARTTLCLAAGSTTSGAAVLLATCNSSALQKWTW
ncbi:MAG: putative galactose oxidase [Frankiales bacterium]|nr:putative galactose oxidase [Frankiales bacterium]